MGSSIIPGRYYKPRLTFLNGLTSKLGRLSFHLSSSLERARREG